jgi:hypothetical protein
MSKRSKESGFIDWIDSAPVEAVRVVLSIANAHFKKRMKGDQPTTPKKRKANSQAVVEPLPVDSRYFVRDNPPIK